MNEEERERIAEQMERAEFRPGGGERKQRKEDGFGQEHRGQKIKSRLKEETEEDRLEKTRKELGVKILQILQKETNPNLHKLIREYLDWVLLGLEALKSEKDWAEIMREKDLRTDKAKSSGPGGQNVQKRSTKVTIKHEPTFYLVIDESTRYQEENEARARKKMFERLQGHLETWQKAVTAGKEGEGVAEVLKKSLEDVQAEKVGGKQVLKEIQGKLKDGINLI